MMREILLGWFGEIPNHEIVFNKYLLALGILILTALMGKLVLFIFEKVLEKLAKKTKSEIDDILFDKTKKPKNENHPLLPDRSNVVAVPPPYPFRFSLLSYSRKR